MLIEKFQAPGIETTLRSHNRVCKPKLWLRVAVSLDVNVSFHFIDQTPYISTDGEGIFVRWN